jgi:WD repeat-containing protein 68
MQNVKNLLVTSLRFSLLFVLIFLFL